MEHEGSSNFLGDSVRISRRKLLFEKLISVEELADVLGLSPQTIRNWVAMRRIPFLRVGGKTRFRRASIEAWLEQKEFKSCL